MEHKVKTKKIEDHYRKLEIFEIFKVVRKHFINFFNISAFAFIIDELSSTYIDKNDIGQCTR